MGELLTIYFYLFGGIIIAAVWFAYLFPEKWKALKSWNKRKDAEMKTAWAERRQQKEEERRLAKLASSSKYSPPSQVTGYRHHRSTLHHHHHDHGDPLLHSLVAGAAAASLRNDVEEVIAREIISDDSGDSDHGSSGDW